MSHLTQPRRLEAVAHAHHIELEGLMRGQIAADVVGEVMPRAKIRLVTHLEEVLEADRDAREIARKLVQRERSTARGLNG